MYTEYNSIYGDSRCIFKKTHYVHPPPTTSIEADVMLPFLEHDRVPGAARGLKTRSHTWVTAEQTVQAKRKRTFKMEDFTSRTLQPVLEVLRLLLNLSAGKHLHIIQRLLQSYLWNGLVLFPQLSDWADILEQKYPISAASLLCRLWSRLKVGRGAHRRGGEEEEMHAKGGPGCYRRKRVMVEDVGV